MKANGILGGTIGMMALLISSASFADGFVCKSDDGTLTVKVYNHTDPSRGTRNGAVMVLSDNNVTYGSKTIARFTDLNKRLSNQGAHYVADVDLRYNDSGRKGERIAGTRLGHIATIELFVMFNYNFPVEAGERRFGALEINKRNGEQISLGMSCTRYLKNN